MKLSADHPDRDFGLVYLDDALATVPTTHALIIGVGEYRKLGLGRLTSTTISARAVADWFTGDSPGFHNPDCPLGSLAILLSEPAAGGDDRASYAGGPVPRATFDQAKSAVRAWLERINSSKDNLAFLYVASHGESFLNRTTFLLEDFGSDRFDVTAGACEIEQFIASLENAQPVSQLLLFDCCRSPTDLALPWNGDFGSRLITLTRQSDDHGEPRKQWTIAATSLGEVAIGRTDKTTLFADALLSALGGVAGDPADEGWPVRPGMLVDRISRLIALHRLPEEKAQTPGGRLSGSFEITFPGEVGELPVYVSMKDPAGWADCRLEVIATPGKTWVIEGRAEGPPFCMLRVPALTEIQIEARRDGQSIGQARSKARAPVSFMEIRKAPLETTALVGRLEAGRSLVPAARILLSVDSPLAIGAGALAEIVRADEPKRNPKQVVVALQGRTPVEVRPGDHLVTLRTPDGMVQTQNVTVRQDEVLEAHFAMPASPHEWLEMATVTGALPEAIFTTAAIEGEPAPGGVIWREMASAGPIAFWPPLETAIAGTVGLDLQPHPLPDPGLAIIDEIDDGRLDRLGLADAEHERFMAHDNGLRARPLFGSIAIGGRKELVVLPSLGERGAGTQGGWRPHLLVDHQAPLEKALTTIVVEDRVWGGLLGFLGSRDIEAGSRLLAGGLTEAAVIAMEEKLSNPLAALAGALVAVAAASPDLDRHWDPWLRNLAQWFPGIPDGPVILGRRLLTRARNADQIVAARQCFLQGFERGVPIYSLTIDWLARGLESLPGEDAELTQRRLAARRLANRIDPGQIFTVIRIS